MPFLFLSQSCEKIKDEIEDAATVEATIELPAVVVTIDSSSYKSTSDDMKVIKEYSVEVDLQEILDDNNIEKAEFKNGKMDAYEATLIYPTGIDFYSFTDEMKVTAALESDFSDEVLVAHTPKISPSTQTVAFLVEDLDITSFIKAEIFYLRIWANKTNELPEKIVNIEFKGKIVVDVKPLI